MTIALGIRGSNGVVLVADSEITDSGQIKGVDTKIMAAPRVITADSPFEKYAALAGAGTVSFYESLREEVAHAVLAGLSTKTEKSDQRIKRRLSNLVGDFHAKHVVPYRDFELAPGVSFLIGTWINGNGGIWTTEMGVATKAMFEYRAIGCGGVHAADILHGYFHDVPTMTVDSACLLAIYTLMRTKATVRGCGQDTCVAVLSDGGAAILPRGLILQIERVFSEYYLNFQSQSFYYATGCQDRLDGGHLKMSREEFDKLRHEIRVTAGVPYKTGV